ncbi:hypothetical protein VTP01DRAFT_3200 [Rhizomucor pusillus]|uniref:uncharacterized protein n=1 Tax=Rhizomucor pusillus TaxID=4840 RepID=UPI00374375B5
MSVALVIRQMLLIFATLCLGHNPGNLHYIETGDKQSSTLCRLEPTFDPSFEDRLTTALQNVETQQLPKESLKAWLHFLRITGVFANHNYPFVHILNGTCPSPFSLEIDGQYITAKSYQLLYIAATINNLRTVYFSTRKRPHVIQPQHPNDETRSIGILEHIGTYMYKSPLLRAKD